MTINMDDYRKEDGNLDWSAYKNAQADAGEICDKCGEYLYPYKGYRVLCYDCQELKRGKGSVDHDRYVRCPKCEHTFNPGEEDYYRLYEEGEHEVYCGVCDHKFEISTSVSYSFQSPPLLNEEEDD